MANYDLQRLERDLRRGAQVQEPARKIVRETAAEVQASWRLRQRARSQFGHIPHLPKSITATVKGGRREPEAEIGPDKTKKQGPLGNLLEFGSRNNRPHNDGRDALAAHEELFVERIAHLAERLL